MTDIGRLLSEVRRVGGPAARLHRGDLTPFVLSCEVDPAIDWDTRTLEESLCIRLPNDLRNLWALSGGVKLFVDQQYGQWGLVIWPPDTVLQRAPEERGARPDEYQPGDLVIGDFLGDADMLLVRCASGAPDFGAVMIVRPIDPRSEWDVVAASVGEFVTRYVEAEGDKFWE